MRMQILATAALVAAATTAQAATITYLGSENNLESFRTTTVTKLYDADGDNVYGTAGYRFWGTGNKGQTVSIDGPETLGSNPSFLSISNGTAEFAFSYAYGSMDDPTLPPGSSVANVINGIACDYTTVESSVFNLSVTSATDFVVGLAVIGLPEQPNGMRVSIGGDTSATIATTDRGYGAPDFYFFSVVGAQLGDTVNINLTPNGDGQANIAGITIDAIAVPEPASLGVICGGLSLLTLRRRSCVL